MRSIRITHNVVVSSFTCSERGNTHEPSLLCIFCSISQERCVFASQLDWSSSRTAAYWWEDYKDFPTHHGLQLPSISIIWLVSTHFLTVLNIFLGRETVILFKRMWLLYVVKNQGVVVPEPEKAIMVLNVHKCSRNQKWQLGILFCIPSCFSPCC